MEGGNLHAQGGGGFCLQRGEGGCNFFSHKTKIIWQAVHFNRLGSMSKVTPVAILTLIINLTSVACFCTCSVIVFIIWQISCWKHTTYCTQKLLKLWTKIYLRMFLTRIESQQSVFVVRIDLWICFCSHIICSLLHCIFRRYFHIFQHFFCFQHSQ